jgi:hypothetical protein
MLAVQFTDGYSQVALRDHTFLAFLPLMLCNASDCPTAGVNSAVDS